MSRQRRQRAALALFARAGAVHRMIDPAPLWDKRFTALHLQRIAPCISFRKQNAIFSNKNNSS